MGKNNRHKKHEKKEKSKVKLKAKKLPKGHNITDTTFKVKKIVIREQLQAPNAEDLVSRRKLNVKELLSHLQHHNMTFRMDGLNGLKEIVALHTDEVVKLHFPQLVEGTVRLVLDQEKDVRRNALKLVETLLARVSTVQIQPLIDVLQSYMACAMTHIKPSIQDDSLLLLDTLLKVCPLLIAARASNILPNFLDMISKLRAESKVGRTLTVDLGKKVTTVRWRIKVLSRLNGLLEAIVAQKKANSSISEQQVVENVPWAKYVPVYSGNPITVCPLAGVLQKASVSTGDEGQAMNNHIKVLMPLLFETWLEIAPRHEEGQANVVPEESAVLLHCILGIIQLSWECLRYYELQTRINDLTLWFRSRCEQDLKKYLLPGFPYALADTPSTPLGKKRRLQQRQEMELLLQSRNPTGPKCIQQNLTVCYLICCVHDGSDAQLKRTVTKYIRRCIGSWEVSDDPALPDLEQTLRQLLLKSPRPWWTESKGILDYMVSKQKQTTNNLSQLLFNLLCDVVLEPNLDYQLRCVKFRDWLGSLPSILCNASVPLRAVQMMSRLACQNNKLFLDNLEHHLDEIISNLQKIRVTGSTNRLEGQKAIVNILFWTTSLNAEKHMDDWSEELVHYVQDCETLREHIMANR